MRQELAINQVINNQQIELELLRMQQAEQHQQIQLLIDQQQQINRLVADDDEAWRNMFN